MPVTPEYAEGHARIFGKDHKTRPGRYIWDVKAMKMVPVGEYVAPPEALNAPICAGRFYEGVQATDGTDLGTRARHRSYMKQNGLTIATDYDGTWKKAKQERAEMFLNGGTAGDKKIRRDQVEKAMYQATNKPRRRK